MAYKQFATIYDKFMENAPYDKWVSLLVNILKAYNIKPNQIIDLGCGTGEVTWRLKALNYNVSGIDLSSEMLTIATEKSVRRGYQIPFINQDITKLEGFENSDVFFSFCDVVNYIVGHDKLKQTFELIYNQLKIDGLFVFDIHDYRYGKIELANHTFTDSVENTTYIWDCVEFEEDILTHELTFFDREAESDLYRKYTETHQQRLYEDDEIIELLKSVGFKEVNIFSDFKLKETLKSDNSSRKFFIAKK